MKSLHSATNCGSGLSYWCREGMYVEAAEWIQAGNNIPTSGYRRKTPLALAAGKGGHSLVRFLLGHAKWSPQHLDAALGRAAAGGHYEVCKLLVDSGAGIGDVVAKEVVLCGNPMAVHYLISKGVDIEAGNALARELLNDERAAMALLKCEGRKLAAVRRQGAIALKQCAKDDDLLRGRWLLNAGASPRIKVPYLYDYDNKSFHFPSSAIWEAYWHSSFHLFLLMGIRKSDDVQDLLNHAWLCRFSWPKMQMLIQRGAKINDKSNGGSTVLEHCIRHLGEWGRFLLSGEGFQGAWDATQRLIQRGAKWIPDKSHYWRLHADFRSVDDSRCFDLAKVLIESRAADADLVWRFFYTKKMRQYRWGLVEKVAKLLGRKAKPYCAAKKKRR